MQFLQNAFAEESLLLDLDAPDLGSILHKVLDFACDRKAIPEEHRDAVEKALLSREEEYSTAIGHAVAIPHAYLDVLEKPAVIFVRLVHPLNLGAPDGIPTRFLFVLIGPTGIATQHLDTLTAIARIMSNDEFRYDAAIARSGQDLTAALERFKTRTMPGAAPLTADVDEGLRYTGKLFGGILGDIRRRYPKYKADIVDGLHPKCVSSTLFLFFACVAPSVMFGGVMATMTDNAIGAVEMIVATAICGVIHALFAGQPLNMLGGTGPMLVFTALLYSLCFDNDIAFLPAYAWVGIWSALFLIILASTDASCLMRFFTRFTDEIFAALISMIFIFEAVSKLFAGFDGLDQTRNHDQAFLTLLLGLGTFYIAMNLSRMRRSRFLQPIMREFLADFGPTIALLVMAFVAYYFRNDVALIPLEAPETFGTTSGRDWSVDIFAAPMWVRFAAIIPALFGTVLIYLDHQITARLVNSRDHKLQRGTGYHLDLTIVGGLVLLCSFFGLPWMVAATVRSLNHVRSLATTEEVVTPGGETRERILHVRENRVTAFSIHMLIGASLLALPLIKQIPMSALYGLFLFMGVVSMSSNQFLERLSLWAMDRNLYPSTHYIRKVPLWTIHKFTLLQFVCLAVLWAVKASSTWGILFPLFIAVLVPVRLIAGRYFADEHLAALDAEEEPDEEDTHWTV